jgi:hypothetical protein
MHNFILERHRDHDSCVVLEPPYIAYVSQCIPVIKIFGLLPEN